MIPNPWVILGVVLAWIASLGAVGVWQNKAGHTDERVAWQGKENSELVAANRKIADLENAARAMEQQHAATVAAIGEQHAKDREALEVQREHDVAAARDGALKLRIAGACKRPDPSPAAETRPSPGGGDDSTTGELPRAVAADLFALADDADLVAKQLGACQAVVKADREESVKGNAQ